jgi:hypothetical protein
MSSETSQQKKAESQNETPLRLVFAGKQVHENPNSALDSTAYLADNITLAGVFKFALSNEEKDSFLADAIYTQGIAAPAYYLPWEE